MGGMKRPGDFLLCVCLSFGLMVSLFVDEIEAVAQQAAVVKIPEIAKETCRVVSEKGKSTAFEGEMDGSLQAMILKRFLGAEGSLKGRLKSEQWTGIQTVTKEQQLAENFSMRDCIGKLIPVLIEFEMNLLKSQERSRIREKSPIRVVTNSASGVQIECLDVRYVDQYPVTVEAGMCVTDETATHISIFQRVSSDVVVYSSAIGASIRCYRGDTCSFGWPGSPVFGVSSNGEKVFLVAGR